MTNVIIEAVVVGLLLAILGLCVSTLLMFFTTDKFSLKKYHFWRSVALAFFISGFIFHVVCEYTGINKIYCTHGSACKKK